MRGFHHRSGRGGRQSDELRHRSGSEDKHAASTPEGIKLQAWLMQVPKTRSVRDLSHIKLSQFFRTGAELAATSEPSILQDLVEHLASDNGLKRVQQLLSNTHSFGDLDLPFLQIITNEYTLNSLALEMHVGRIYNWLYGTQGNRAAEWLERCTSSIEKTQQALPQDYMDLNTLRNVSLIIHVLLKILETNQAASVNESFHSIVDIMQRILDKLGASTEGSVDEQDALRALAKIRRHLQYGMDLTEVEIEKARTDTGPTFKLEIDGPGQMSFAGARHDNDSDDIQDIKILPTAAELTSHRAEYLPVKDADTWHLEGIHGLLDQQFRLLREDTVGQLRDAVALVAVEHRNTIESGTEGEAQQTVKSLPRNRIRTFKYEDVKLGNVFSDRHSKLLMMVDFQQPEVVRRKKVAEREKWWRETKQLQVDALVCLVDSDGNNAFFVVEARAGHFEDPRKRRKFPLNRNEEDEDDSNDSSSVRSSQIERERQNTANLWRDEKRATVTLRLINLDQQNFTDVLKRDARRQRGGFLLVELPGVLLQAFQPTLKALQRMSRHGDVPFSDILGPGGTMAPNIGWPHYARQPQFRFDLGPIVSGDEPLVLRHGVDFDYEALSKRSTLDEAQGRALIGALSRELALIQGPPGTGKSYVAIQIMKILLAQRRAGKLGPIIVVCYTNHALDQFLEHLIEDGIQQIIRIGSRSKSPALQNLTLHSVSQKLTNTKLEKANYGRTRHELELSAKMVIKSFEDARTADLPGLVLEHLQEINAKHYYQLKSLQDDDGFVMAKDKRRDNVNFWLNGDSDAHPKTQDDREIDQLNDVPLFQMRRSERRTLYDYWVSMIQSEIEDDLQKAIELYAEQDQRFYVCKQELNLRCLLQAHVIGLTTSGLAMHTDVLRRLNPKVLLCEEAGEILEAHTLTAFLPSIQHAILIGDHEQLRPQIKNWELDMENAKGEQYSLNTSMFERLITSPNSNMPYDTLETQRRMDPSISNLIRQTIYPDLTDHEAVTKYPQVSGMRKRLFWLDHSEWEDQPDSTRFQQTSHANSYEAAVVESMVTRLVRQGTYTADDIVILTPYILQVHLIRNILGKSFDIVIDDRDLEELKQQGLATVNPKKSSTFKAMLRERIRVSSVDNFQGEEAKIIIVSLVRSNKQRSVGFLRTSNRINVLLSRAQHGLYIIGSSRTAEPVKMWATIMRMLEQSGNIGTAIPLRCPQHPSTEILVSTPDDFATKAPEGGCDLPCDWRLDDCVLTDATLSSAIPQCFVKRTVAVYTVSVDIRVPRGAVMIVVYAWSKYRQLYWLVVILTKISHATALEILKGLHVRKWSRYLDLADTKSWLYVGLSPRIRSSPVQPNATLPWSVGITA